MFKRILVPLDGSTRAERALPVAAQVARATGASIALYRAVPIPATYGAIYAGVPINQVMIDEDALAAKTYLESMHRSELLQGIPVTCITEVGDAANLILDQANDRVDLIVMCSHGRSNVGRWVLGSVAEHVARLATPPVLVLREHGKMPLDSPDPDHLLRVLVPLDSSPTAELALAPAAQLATALGAPHAAALHLTLVAEPLEAVLVRSVPQELLIAAAKGYLVGIVKRLQTDHPSLTITWSVSVDADVATGILRVAEVGEDTEGVSPFGGCDVIVMTTHGRSGFERWALGSIAERVLHGTRLTVMIVRQQQHSATTSRETPATSTVR